MFIINKSTKETKEIKEGKFSDLQLFERQDLQEWIAKNPRILGEDLLIVQKEFDGFENTKERLDLLALDPDGNLVIIENKLDSSGTDVVWQAMKYASYCACLTKENIKDIYQQYIDKYGLGYNAEQRILDFLNETDWSDISLNEDLTQRIILVAHNFRKEVTNTVIWARKFKMQIQCIKIIPYERENEILIDVDQIIPTKDIQDIMIKYDEKVHEDNKIKQHSKRRNAIMEEFRTQFVPEFKEKSKSNLLKGRNVDGIDLKNNRFSAGSGISGVRYRFVVTQDSAYIQLRISKSDNSEYNKKVYDFLYSHKKEIEDIFGDELSWDRGDSMNLSKIYYKKNNVDVSNKEDRIEINKFLIEKMPKFESALKKYIEEYKKN